MWVDFKQELVLDDKLMITYVSCRDQCEIEGVTIVV